MRSQERGPMTEKEREWKRKLFLIEPKSGQLFYWHMCRKNVLYVLYKWASFTINSLKMLIPMCSQYWCLRIGCFCNEDHLPLKRPIFLKMHAFHFFKIIWANSTIAFRWYLLGVRGAFHPLRELWKLHNSFYSYLCRFRNLKGYVINFTLYRAAAKQDSLTDQWTIQDNWLGCNFSAVFLALVPQQFFRKIDK